MAYRAEIEFGKSTIVIESGNVAKQAAGSVWVQCGGTVVICSACWEDDPKPENDFFPLTVDYRERASAAGRFPGGYFKREGRPSEKETLTSRLIDRPLRPLFPDGFSSPVHVVSFVLSHDQQHEPDVLALFGASAALMISDIPFQGPISPIRIGRLDGQFVINPTFAEQELSDLNLTVACSETSIVMVEGGAKELPEDVILDALSFAFQNAQPLNVIQREMVRSIGKEKTILPEIKLEWVGYDSNPLDIDQLMTSYKTKMKSAILSPSKEAVSKAVKSLYVEMAAKVDLKDQIHSVQFNRKFSSMESSVARELILNDKIRNDSRKHSQIRPIKIDIGMLPCVHGSAIFTRGQTQALVTLTLGTTQDEQRIDDLEGESYKSFMLHYNFPQFAVGEVGAIRGPGRREVGHGALAERAIRPMIPPEEVFPYTIRIVSDILESNGSSSMATVCGASLCLMDGGVPIKAPVAGIAMGLVLEGSQYAVLSDISGMEDHLGDMDFKVAGTQSGITAIQMDIKLTGFPFEIFRQALDQARQGRLEILEKMEQVLPAARSELRPFAPRIHIMKINTEKIASLIGPGGKTIRALTAETGAKIEIEEDGTVKIWSADLDRLNVAVTRVTAITEEITVGKDYMGVVRRIEPYGAFLEIAPGSEGLLHISRFANYRVREVQDEMKEGDQVLVRVAEIDRAGKIKLTRKELMDEGKVQGKKPPEQIDQSEQRRDRDDRPHRRNSNHESGNRHFRRPGYKPRHE